MPIPQIAPSLPPELRQALGAEGETDYQQLLKVTSAAQGSFFLFIIESDFPRRLQDELLDQLGADLSASGLQLRRVTLSQRCWDLFELLEGGPVARNEVCVLLGVENTPGIVHEPGRTASRSPIFALLNQQRETLRKRLPVPLLVWCLPHIYEQFQREAPDFFDHYAGLFQFMSATPIAQENQPRSPQNAFSPEDTRQTGSPSARRMIEFYEKQLSTLPESAPERADALLGLASALLDSHGSNFVMDRDRALHLAQETLDLLTIEDNPYDWARGQVIMGNAFVQLSVGNRNDNLLQAITCYKAALQACTEADFPTQWAGTQNNLGNVYSNLPGGDRAENLLQALVCYQAALKVYTEADFPVQWAMTQNNLGNVYSNLPGGDRAENLLQAIACYQAALRVRTEQDYPMQWAMTQNNLGTVYRNLPSGDRTENLLQAIACYQAALRVRTKQDFPRDWAGTQNNLGNVYSNLPSGDRAQNLLQAIACYQATLKVYTEADFPRDWADTQFNLALAYEEVGDRVAARLAMQQSVTGYRQVGMLEEAQKSEDWLAQHGEAQSEEG